MPFTSWGHVGSRLKGLTCRDENEQRDAFSTHRRRKKRKREECGHRLRPEKRNSRKEPSSVADAIAIAAHQLL